MLIGVPKEIKIEEYRVGLLPVNVQALVATRPQFAVSDVEQAVGQALRRFLHPLTGGPDKTGWPFGRTVYRSEIIQAIETVPGVDCVQSVALTPVGPGGVRDANGNIGIPPQYLVCPGAFAIEFAPPATECRGARK